MDAQGPLCGTPKGPDTSGLREMKLHPDTPCADYREAMALAEETAARELGECMLLSWYDRDRDFEAPQHTSECHRDSAVPGYVDYALYRGADLKLDLEDGRFVFFYLGLDF